MFIHLPTGMTFPKIQAGLDPAQLSGLNSWLTTANQPTVAEGDDNPFFLELLNFPAGGAPFSKTAEMSGLAVCGPIRNVSHFPAMYFSLFPAIGGDITEMPVYFEFANASDLDADVPPSFPNRTYTELSDPDDPDSTVTRTHTWQTWGTQRPEQYGGKWYRSSEDWDRAVPASAWVGQGLTVKTEAEFRKISSAGSPT